MNPGIIFIIQGVVVLTLHFLFRKANSKPIEVFQGTGTICAITHTNSGYPRYYVKFLHNGEVISGKSYSYASGPLKKIGDYVEFDYFVVSEGPITKLTGVSKPWARIIIYDEHYKDPRKKKKSHIAFVIGSLLLILGVVLMYTIDMV